MSYLSLASSGKIVTAPGSILSTSSRSTTSPPSSSVFQRLRNASCSITTTRSSKPDPGGVMRRRPRPSACSGRILFAALSGRSVTITQTLRTSQPSRSIRTLTMQRIRLSGASTSRAARRARSRSSFVISPERLVWMTSSRSPAKSGSWRR